MNFTRLFFSFCDLLRRENSASRIGAGVALGFLIAFSPLLTLQGAFYVGLAITLRVNVTATALSLICFQIVHWWLVPVLSVVGHWLLTDAQTLSAFWTWAYHSPLLPLTRFNHTAVMGGLAVSTVLAIPLYWLTKLTVMVAGEQINRRIRETMHSFSSGTSRLLRLYAQHQRQNPT